MSRRLTLSLPVVVATLLSIPTLAWAQVGSISGVVRDASQAVLPGVTIDVTSPALIEKVRSTTTDGNGRYQITALPVGTYTVTFTLSGFATTSRSNVVVTSDFTAPVNAELTVGGVTDTVNVVAEAPAVDVVNARQQTVFQGSEIAELPTQRDIASLVTLVPGVQSNPGTGICNGGIQVFCNPNAPAFNAHVAPNDDDGQNQGRLLVDGMVINAGRPAAGGGQQNFGISGGIVINTANVQEVAFTLSGALGESETGGASINIVPRTGGNRYAGNYFTSYTQTRFFDRNRGTHLTDTPDSQEFVYDYDVNGAFGGPIVRDRLWFYVQGRQQGSERYPSQGTQGGFANLNEGLFGANYVPDRDRGWLTYSNEYRNANVRLTLQATPRDKFNIYWDEQSSCLNPCYGMINIVDSPEAYFSLQASPNRLMQLSWTNPFTNRTLFEAGVSVVSTHTDRTKHREYPNYRDIPRVCETGPTVGRDGVAIKVNSNISNAQGGAGVCNVFNTMTSGSINDQFPSATTTGTFTLSNDDTYRSRASASYITGSHNAKIGFDGVYYATKVRNEVNAHQMGYHYQTPITTGGANCLAPATQAANPHACGNMSLYYPDDPFNTTYLRPKPVGFHVNTGAATTDERVWFGALYIQDQWTVNRFTLSGALRYDHAESRYGETCFGPNRFVPLQDDGTNAWCSTPAKGVRYNDITPRWGLAWDVFGSGKTSLKMNMGKYLQAASLTGIYVDDNEARKSTNVMTRGWDDLNGNRIVECEFFNPAPHTFAAGDTCGSLLQADGQPSSAFLQFGRPPNPGQLFTPDSFCGRTENSSPLHRDYCAASGQNLMAGWGARRYEWQFGLGIQHEVLPRLSAEVTYNRRTYGNLLEADTIGRGCDYYLGADPQACFDGYLNYQGVHHDFFSVTAPVDPRLPEGGGYVIRGLDNQSTQGALPDLGDVTTVREELEYSWAGLDTNIVFRGGGGFRVSGGTSTGRSVRNTCYTDGDSPNVKGREGNEYGGGCVTNNPLQTNVRGNASYTIPWVDVLVGTIYQYRPGAQMVANLTLSSDAVAWEPGDADRGTLPCDTNGGTPGGQAVGCFFTAGANPTTATTVNLLDTGDLFLEGIHIVDLNFQKNFRFAGKRLNVGVNVYNLLNSDAVTGYTTAYTAFWDPAAGTWVTDNPSTPDVEENEWGNPTNLQTPRFMRFTVQFDF